MDVYMTFFNSEVERYLKHLDEVTQEELSLDEFLDNIDDEDEKDSILRVRLRMRTGQCF